MKYSDTPNYECEETCETIDHYLIECSIYNENRETIMEQIREKWMKSRRFGCLKSRSPSCPKFYETDFEKDGQCDQESSVQVISVP